jgi:hypothetical protein
MDALGRGWGCGCTQDSMFRNNYRSWNGLSGILNRLEDLEKCRA